MRVLVTGAARAIADAIDNPDTPLRVPVGEDAELNLGTRQQSDDVTFAAALRHLLQLSW